MNMIPPLTDVLGWAAAALTLLAFTCNGIVRLRYAALAANSAFIAYGVSAQLWPVLALHFVLAPINLWRLAQTLQRTMHPVTPTLVPLREPPLAQRPTEMRRADTPTSEAAMVMTDCPATNCHTTRRRPPRSCSTRPFASARLAGRARRCPRGLPGRMAATGRRLYRTVRGQRRDAPRLRA